MVASVSFHRHRQFPTEVRKTALVKVRSRSALIVREFRKYHQKKVDNTPVIPRAKSSHDAQMVNRLGSYNWPAQRTIARRTQGCEKSSLEKYLLAIPGVKTVPERALRV